MFRHWLYHIKTRLALLNRKDKTVFYCLFLPGSLLVKVAYELDIKTMNGMEGKDKWGYREKLFRRAQK